MALAAYYHRCKEIHFDSVDILTDIICRKALGSHRKNLIMLFRPIHGTSSSLIIGAYKEQHLLTRIELFDVCDICQSAGPKGPCTVHLSQYLGLHNHSGC